MPEGATKLKECENHAQVTMDSTGLKGRQNLQQELEVLKLDWDDYSTKLNSLKDNLEQALHYWHLYETSYQQLSGWLKAMEKQIKECPLKSTLEEKQEQLARYQVINYLLLIIYLCSMQFYLCNMQFYAMLIF